MDKNGYIPSIIESVSDCECYLCGKRCRTQRHEIFHGSLRRERSKQYGLWVSLCPECHFKLHNSNGEKDRFLKRSGEMTAINKYGWTKEEFIRIFGKNYLEEDIFTWLNNE